MPVYFWQEEDISRRFWNESDDVTENVRKSKRFEKTEHFLIQKKQCTVREGGAGTFFRMEN